MDVVEWVTSALAIAIGAFILYAFIQAFGETYSGFREYGWLLMGAYVSGAVLFLKYGLSGKTNQLPRPVVVTRQKCAPKVNWHLVF